MSLVKAVGVEHPLHDIVGCNEWGMNMKEMCDDNHYKWTRTSKERKDPTRGSSQASENWQRGPSGATYAEYPGCRRCCSSRLARRCSR